MDSEIHPHAKYSSYSQLLITAEKKKPKQIKTKHEMKTGTQKKGEKQNSTEQKKTKF